MIILRYTFAVSALTGLLLTGGCSHPKAIGGSSAAASSQIQPAAPRVSESVEHAELSGRWNYTMTSEEQGTLTGVLTIQKGGNSGYTGHITANEMQLDSETNITKAQLTGSDFIYEGVVKSPEGNIPFTITGTIHGSELQGRNTVQYKNQNLVFKVKATRN